MGRKCYPITTQIIFAKVAELYQYLYLHVPCRISSQGAWACFQVPSVEVCGRGWVCVYSAFQFFLRSVGVAVCVLVTSAWWCMYRQVTGLFRKEMGLSVSLLHPSIVV